MTGIEGAVGQRNSLRVFLERYGRWLIILPPMLFLLVFFLIPFGFALKISVAETALRIPPFTDLYTVTPDHHLRLVVSLANYRYLFTDEVYAVSYFYSIKTALISTLLCLLLGQDTEMKQQRHGLRATAGPLVTVDRKSVV